ncbi:MAG TPA: hypothetical protein DCQ26_17455 [Marinilabiliales bacterium]|nr:MAG: hypothetical protein A2W84_09190 [Bacteroidetes bacterium GWC2_40_13]OFX73038.1 MAG: hypothetical protein A2W96_13185 [Bacteroidetes bacterium GWD2_40_43]OFX91516.1 MAG: hypothetical protein A2W97_04775 [Bacteroidetes bacterium GWE2_40_63]OFY19678.1 MAG: hypothetical protein A2W88_02665 [Bacteroidetes bacterium GWF2_40_13]OFZ25480.1 MAG: hypothetical protein A2437_12975 [Bacteroidetes bacterium RIFOXYC2_FULL_40_12]HAN00384.1 hypothetical protein [Marinilabiliales bacterium]
METVPWQSWVSFSKNLILSINNMCASNSKLKKHESDKYNTWINYRPCQLFMAEQMSTLLLK